MSPTKKRLYPTQLPATPCSEELRESVIGLAAKHEVSIADIQRQALELFLSHSDSKAISDESLASEVIIK